MDYGRWNERDGMWTEWNKDYYLPPESIGNYICYIIDFMVHVLSSKHEPWNQ